jgi:type II secretory pathway predicted ATPase ExeA
MTSYLTHFALNAAPFTKEMPDAHLWLPSAKQRIVDEVVDAIAEHESVELVGDSGVGKTCVLRALRHRMGQKPGIKLTYCHNVTLGRRDFYRQLCLALGLAPSATAAAVFYAVSTHVEGLGRDKLYPVFVLDEAHLSCTRTHSITCTS